MPNPCPELPAWIRLKADAGFEAVIHSSHLDAYAESLLCWMAKLDEASGETPPTVQLDCSADVAREVVSVLRLGSSYVAPADQRLLKAVQRQLAFWNIERPTTYLPDTQEVILLPSYMSEHSHLDDSAGLLLYSATANGWSNRTGHLDPRPKGMFQLDTQDGFRGNKMMSAVLRAEMTGVEEDVVCMVPNYLPVSYGSHALLLRSSLRRCSFPAPPRHTESHLYDSAMVAAAGKLCLLGGTTIGWPIPPLNYCPFEVFDPHLGSWFESTPLPHQVQLSGHSLITNRNEGMLLAIGGWGEAQNSAASYQFMSDSIFRYDFRTYGWDVNPSGCRWRRAATACSLSAVTLDDYRVMVLSTGTSSSTTANVDILDLRTWKFTEGPQLERSSKCLQAMGLVVYDGKVLAIGGAGRGFGGEASREVHAYDVSSDSWVQMPPLPFGVRDASPVVMRMQSAMKQQPFPAW